MIAIDPRSDGSLKVGSKLVINTYARKYHESLHFLSECHWYELTSADCPDRVEACVN